MATPPVPEAQLTDGGWELAEATDETIFELSRVRVTGSTKRYEDAATRERLRVATGGDVDRMVQFFAVTTLAFEPELPSGGLSAIGPVIRSKAVETFERRLKGRGLGAIRRRRTDSYELESGTADLTTIGAVDPIDGHERGLSLECWIAVWIADRPRVVTGGYPAEPLSAVFDLPGASDELARSRTQYREEFFELLEATAAK